MYSSYACDFTIKLRLILFSFALSVIDLAHVQVLSGGNNETKGHGKDTINHEENYLDTLSFMVDNWFKDFSISWDELLDKLDSLKQHIPEKYGPESLSLAYIIHKQGVVHYYKGLKGHADDFYEAIKYYGAAIRIRMAKNREGSESLIPDIINGYNNIGGCYLKLQRPYKAIENLLIALQLAEDYHARDDIYLSILKLNTLTAKTLTEIGDYDNALLYYSKIIHFTKDKKDRKSEDDIDIWKIRALIGTGGIQSYYLNMQETAIDNLHLAQEMLQSKEYPDGEILLANSYHNLAIAWKLCRDYDKSFQCYNESIAINNRLNRTFAMADNYLGMGNLLIKMGKLNNAEHFLHKAGNLYSILDAQSELSFIYDNLGDVEFKRGNFLRSLEYDNRAIKLLLSGFVPESVHSEPCLENNIIPDKHGLLISLTSKANAFLHLYKQNKDTGYLMSAFRHFILADTVIGLIRSEFVADASKMTLVQLAKPVYEKAIETCWELYSIIPRDDWLNMAFRFSEKSRAIVLLDAVRKIKAGATIPEDLLKREKGLNLSINYHEKQLVLQNNHQDFPDNEMNFIDTLLSLKRKYTGLLNQIKTQYPDYFGLIYDQKTVGIEKISNTLSHDQSLIEYFIGDENIYIFCIDRDKTLFVKSGQADSIRCWASEFNKYIREQDLQFSVPASGLYRSLIHPVSKKDTLPARLILVPDDVLSSVCFEALITGNPSSKNVMPPSYKDFLLYRHQVCYAFSATTMLESHRKAHRPARSFLGIAPLMEHGFYIGDHFFGELDRNMDEVRQIKKIMGGKNILGRKATRSEILKNISAYNLIHFATHARANDMDGSLSFIVMGPDDSDIIYARDLYALDLNASLVVLSACETASGSLNKGEGIISLARGFIYSGSSAVVTGLWDIRENVNKDIILKLYKGIRSGLPADRALREAKLSFLESVTPENPEKVHPYFWAPLICIGSTTPYLPKNSHTWIWIAGSLTLLAVLIWALKRRTDTSANL